MVPDGKPFAQCEYAGLLSEHWLFLFCLLALREMLASVQEAEPVWPWPGHLCLLGFPHLQNEHRTRPASVIGMEGVSWAECSAGDLGALGLTPPWQLPHPTPSPGSNPGKATCLVALGQSLCLLRLRFFVSKAEAHPEHEDPTSGWKWPSISQGCNQWLVRVWGSPLVEVPAGLSMSPLLAPERWKGR